MNNNYKFPGAPVYSNSNQSIQLNRNTEYIPTEKSYIENIIRINKGKKISIYQSFSNSNEWRDKEFTGIIEQSGKDHVILSDPTSGNWYLLLMKYIDYIKFEEDINSAEQFYATNF